MILSGFFFDGRIPAPHKILIFSGESHEKCFVQKRARLFPAPWILKNQAFSGKLNVGDREWRQDSGKRINDRLTAVKRKPFRFAYAGDSFRLSAGIALRQ